MPGTNTDGAPTSGAERGGARGGSRGGRPKRSGQRRGRGGRGGAPANPAAQDITTTAAASKAHAIANGAPELEDDDSAELCFICANPVAHYAVSPCNHTTCHICALRMRALYKTKDCATCRTPAPFVIFADDGEKRYEEYVDGDFKATDTNIGIRYVNEDVCGDTVLLLRYNCPDESCDYAGLGWPDLHKHVRSTHRGRMCDLCTRNRKIFTHEHRIFADSGRELEKHMRGSEGSKSGEVGTKGHPLCNFCGERFFDDDKLFDHCRQKHERCFLCDRHNSARPHYYLNYDALEEHFKKDHFLCDDRECLEKKFVVFESSVDLQAHNLSEHGGKTIGREQRLVDMSGFDIRQSWEGEGSRRQRGGGRGRGRGRDPNTEDVPSQVNQPLRRDEIAFQRTMAIHSAQSVTPRTFGGQLSAPTPAQASTPRARPQPPPSLFEPEPANAAAMTPAQHARAVRHSAVVERASNLLGNDAEKMVQFRAHISSYRQGSVTAAQLLDAFFTLFADTSSTGALGTLVQEVAELFEDKTKGDSLRKSWQDWRAINEDYPSLPNALSGMQGGSSGWAGVTASRPAIASLNATPTASTRVLRLKNATRLAGPSASSVPGANYTTGPTPSSSTAVPSWTQRTGGTAAQSAPKANSSAAFPSLPAAGKKNSVPLSTWASTSSGPSQSSSPAPRANNQRAPASDSFPALPAAPKPTTTIFGYGTGRGVRRDFGNARDSGFQWGGSPSSSGAATPAATEEAEDESGKGKKGQKKNKKVLVQWG